MEGRRKSKSPAVSILRVSTYAELREFVAAFRSKHLGLLFVFGDPGIGKSRIIRDVLEKDACWIDGNITPFYIYIMAYEHRGQPIVLDDVDGLYSDRKGVRLLKGICQSEPVKTVSWHSDAATLRDRGIPHSFETSSRLVIVGNRWKSLNIDIEALEDRGHFVVFEPDPLEVHRFAQSWFRDTEILNFIKKNLAFMQRPSLRTYVKAAELKAAGLDWRRFVLESWLSGPGLIVARLKNDLRFASEEERVRAFVKSGAGSRSTYFNHAKKLAAKSDRRVAERIVHRGSKRGVTSSAHRP